MLEVESRLIYASVLSQTQLPGTGTIIEAPAFAVVLAVVTTVILGLWRTVERLRSEQQADREAQLKALGVLEARLLVVESGHEVWRRVMESRVLTSFAEHANPITEEERALFARIHDQGSDRVSEAELLRAIQILDREVDEGHLSDDRRSDAFLALGLLNQHLAERQLKPVASQIAAERVRELVDPKRNGATPPWWRRWWT